MDEQYARAYGDLARRHWWWRVRDAAVADALDRWLPGRRAGRVLDVGCGDGRMFPLLSRHGIVAGVEPGPGATDGSVPGGTIHAAPFERPLPVEGPFDLITLFDVLEHLDDPLQALRLSRELLAPDGTLLLTVPALPVLWTSHDDINHHRRRFTARGLRALLDQGGFATRERRYLFHSLVPPKLVMRFVESIRAPADPVPTVPAAPLNAALALAFRLETRLAGPFARWLPGSSLLVVAVAA